jgi:hypothetical protein
LRAGFDEIAPAGDGGAGVNAEDFEGSRNHEVRIMVGIWVSIS